MIKVDNLSYSYGRHKGAVLENFCLMLDRPGIYGLLGPNGAGKSTLLYLLAGALTPTGGAVTFNGISTRSRIPGVLADIMLVPEEFTLPGMRLDDFMATYGAMYPHFDAEAMQRCLAEFSFPVQENPWLNALSMGQKKKVYISFALACNTPVLLMDEPTNGLDIQGKAAFRRLVAQLIPDNRILLISTHQVRDLDSLLDHIVIMTRQTVLLNASVMQLQRALVFRNNVDVAEAASALYSLPSVGGADAVFANRYPDDVATDINLEVLFDFALNNPEAIAQAINDTNSPTTL